MTTYIEQKEEKKIIILQKACIETSKEKREKNIRLKKKLVWLHNNKPF